MCFCACRDVKIGVFDIQFDSLPSLLVRQLLITSRFIETNVNEECC